MEFSLGRYKPNGDVVKMDGSKGIVSYSQLFEGGSNNRQSRVTYTCNSIPNPTPNTAHILRSVREVKELHYEFEVQTTLLCRDADNKLVGLAGSDKESNIVDSKKVDAKSDSPKSSASADSEETGRLASGPHKTGPGLPHVLDLLEPLGEKCLYLNTGWWTYKVCYLKEITQFHREQVAVTADGQIHNEPPMLNVKTGARSAAEAEANIQAALKEAKIQMKFVTTAEFTLGLLPSSTTQAELDADAKIVRGDSWETTYVSQHYHSGTLCDLNNRPRMTETRIFCDMQESSHVIKSVIESATCEYVMVIHTPTICQHPLFKPDVPKVLEITCEPLHIVVDEKATNIQPTPPHQPVPIP